MKVAKLKAMWEELNREYFTGELQPIVICITRGKKYWGKFLHPRGPSGASPCIFLSGVLNKSPEEWRDSLLHEMCHQYLYEKGITEQDDHGPLFMEVATKCGIRLSEC